MHKGRGEEVVGEINGESSKDAFILKYANINSQREFAV